MIKDINRILKKDSDCQRYLPMTSDSLSNAFIEGIIFAKLVNMVQPNSVHKEDFTVVFKSYEAAVKLNLINSQFFKPIHFLKGNL